MDKLLQWFKDYLIPHQKNGYKPSFFGKESIVVILTILLLIELAYLGQLFIVVKKTDFLAAVLPSVLSILANEDRIVNNAIPLTVNPLLAQAAIKKAEDMVKKGYFSHTSPEGVLPWYWLDKVGYNYSYAGENLAVNFTDSKDVQNAWLNSSAHKANIIKKEFKEIGIGTAEGKYQGKDATFVVEFFGTPARSNTVAVAKKSNTQTPISVSDSNQLPAKVLGEETAIVVKTDTSKIQPIKSSLEIISTSPVSTTRNILYVLVGIFSIVLALAVLIKIKVQHAGVIASGLALIAISLILISFNKSFSGVVELPTDTNEASAVLALP